MNDYWLTLFGPAPRRIRVIENLLKNRLSAATVFWTVTYGIEPAVGSARHLQRRDYEAWLNAQARAGNLVMDREQRARLTPAGQAVKARLLAAHYRPHFGDWGWRVNGERLAARLLLAVQVVSEFAHHHRNYLPLNIGGGEMALVKRWALRAGGQLVPRVYRELTAALGALDAVDQRLAPALVSSLIGYETSGATGDQLGTRLGVSEAEAARLLADAWLGLAAQLAGGPGPLAALVAPLIAPTPLSRSATETLADFRSGLMPEAISQRRHRKLSTIREHLLLAALLMPEAADYSRLISPAVMARFSRGLVGPPADWQFTPGPGDPAQEFFYFRLWQILRTVTTDGRA